MDDKNKSTLIDFITAKEAILKELSSLESVSSGEISLPEISPEKNEIKVEFQTSSIGPEQIVESIKTIKNHIENIRIHTFEPGFYVFQALNENVFDSKSILDNIKFRFISSNNGNRVEVSKKGDFKREEIFAIIALFKYITGANSKKNANPKELLNRLGVNVFDPAEEALSGNLMTFDHIAGYSGVKQEILESIVMPILSPYTFDQVSKLTRKFPTRNRPRAVLFEGDPGVGKTTMAKVVSCLCKIPMVYVPIESILSKYYGESSQNLAYVFDAAALFPSSLIFLDEIDSLAGSREEGIVEATRKLLSVLLRKLDGFEGKPRTITIGATNRKQDLDRALLSRFDKSIYFPLPDPRERAAILENYAFHLTEDNRTQISNLLEGYSGRNLKDFCDFVERKWAAAIIERGLQASPPPFEVYKEAAEVIQKNR
ncbi:MAG TPA: ATP-binding protein [Leptospiraceae bacterium]|nr:ATP-binding protein [Leptospiraceae bacterium]HMX31242.1 ATP-binding protein [Leptospiraceae bacterium]HMY29448.1 ATP-binding protein [Leptospiraceae bacterium]HNA06365.1 ATP-binding protein [Leptospiraceae bacterium]HNB96596.1 ATP-binding protein [Leptospiraceae bacterium]